MKSSAKKKKSNLANQKRSPRPLAALDFFAEAGLLKRVKRSGWWVAGIKDPESVAEHSFRCAIMAHYMACREGANPYRAVMMALFNDIHEARINDLHKMGHYYIDFKAAEKKVFAHQVQHLEPKVKNDLMSLRCEYDQQSTVESLIARDADILECLLQAKEYDQAGHRHAKIFLTRASAFLKTQSARQLWRQLRRWDSASWWQQVVKFER